MTNYTNTFESAKTHKTFRGRYKNNVNSGAPYAHSTKLITIVFMAAVIKGVRAETLALHSQLPSCSDLHLPLEQEPLVTATLIKPYSVSTNISEINGRAHWSLTDYCLV